MHNQDPGHHQTLRALADVKIGWLLTVLVALATGGYVASFALGQRAGTLYGFLSGLIRFLSDASLGSAIVGFAYEWLVRRETSDTLRSLFRTSLEHHQRTLVNTVVTEIPRALLLDEQVQKTVLVSTEKVNEIIRGALRARLGDEEMSGSIYEGLLQKTFSYTERFVDLRTEVTLSNVGETEPQDVRSEFFDAVMSLRYRTRLRGTRFIFARAVDHDQFNFRIRHPDYLFTWRLEESPSLPRDSSAGLDLYRFAVDDVELPRTPRVSDDGAYEIVCEDPALEERSDREVTIHYSVKTKLRRHDHLFFYSTVRPTRGVTLTFDYARADIESVLTYDFFVSASPPVIYQMPPERPHMTVVSLDEWVFPKGGVAFVWKLQGEEAALAPPTLTDEAKA